MSRARELLHLLEPQITMEIGGFGEQPWLSLDGESFLLRRGRLCHYGFDDCLLTDELFRVLVVLAVAKKRGEKELPIEVLAERVGITPTAVAKLLPRVLCKPDGPGASREGVLVWYEVKESPSGGRSGGRSKGPYKLNLPANRIVVDLNDCDRFLSGERVHDLVVDGEPLVVLQQASAIAGRGEFTQGIKLARAVLVSLGRGDNAFRTVEDRHLFKGRAFQLIANLQMELGSWEQGIKSAKMARRLFGTQQYGEESRLRHPEEHAEVHQLLAHLYGQAGGRKNAIRATREADLAVRTIENSRARERRIGMYRAVLHGVLGQRYSQAGYCHDALKPLTLARTVAREEGARQWEAIWSVRLAQNAVLRHDLKTAELELGHAVDLAPHMTVAGNAALWRAKVELFIEARSWIAAEQALEEANRFGEEFGMEHQKREVERLRARLGGEQRR